MMITLSADLINNACEALAALPATVDELDAEMSASPGLYAIYGSGAVWHELGLGDPPHARPLYVGKAENTLSARDLRGHFGMRQRGVQSPTGSSTVRRSLAALLAPTRGYRGIPRNPTRPGHFSNFGLSAQHDDDLSAWMARELRLALWPHRDTVVLDAIETGVLIAWLPPLNLDKVHTPWKTQVSAARKRLAQQARE